MPDLSEFLKEVKKAANEASEASKPVSIGFGLVSSASPLQIVTEQKMTLYACNLVLSERVTAYSVTVDGKTVIIRSGLAAGDRVILIREQGGERYFVIDKVGS